MILDRYLLSILTWLPLLGAFCVLFFPRQAKRALVAMALGFMVLEAGISLKLLSGESASTAMRFVERVDWIPSLGIRYQLGVDGLSLWLVLLTTFVTPLALLGSLGGVTTRLKEYCVAFLLLQTGMIGAFVALDLFLFYVFWELMLVPMYLLIGVFGGQDRIRAALKFFLYTFAGSVLMLVAILYTVVQYEAVAGRMTFDLLELNQLELPMGTQQVLFIAFALAFAVKVPMFPLHTWLPDAHTEAPTGGSVILAAVLLKLGCYGFLRFAIPLFPRAAYWASPTLALIAVVGILYGAFCAWAQRDVKRLVAYSSVSHLGFVMLGIFTMNPAAVSGAILQMINHGISTGALFLLVGVIYDRRHTRDLGEFGGLATPMPAYATVFVIATMSSIGLPGTNGFVGEFMILSGTFLSDLGGGFINTNVPWRRLLAALGGLGVLLGAVYMLHVVLKMFWGPVWNKKNAELRDLSARELVTLLPLVAAIFVLGFYPKLVLDDVQPTVTAYVRSFQSRLAQTWVADAKEARLLTPPPAGGLARPTGDAPTGEGAAGGGAPSAGGGTPSGQPREVRVRPPRIEVGGGAP
ncbi:MAG: NADH-quinone oxidoreductase subunit M [Deltaproteobacteria bacterium]|nr:NADH-quinone oxidoreductase subunit M [Deltaproteobacteria bacterium]